MLAPLVLHNLLIEPHSNCFTAALQHRTFYNIRKKGFNGYKPSNISLQAMPILDNKNGLYYAGWQLIVLAKPKLDFSEFVEVQARLGLTL